jgi:hypothetical protein
MSINWIKPYALGIGGFFVYFFVVIPVFHIQIPCVFHAITDLFCPGCGMTRSILALSHLELYQAVRFNLLPFALAPFAGGYFIARWKRNEKWETILLWIMIILALAYGIARNIPAWCWLIPTDV